MKKILSIIIVSYNTKDFLEKCLGSIFHQSDNKDLEVIVVDNGSKDDSCETIKNRFLQVKLIENKENLGFGRANNQGAKIARSDYLFFLNPDTLIKDNIFPKIIEVFKNDSQTGVVSPLLILDNGEIQPWAYGQEENLSQLIKRKIKKDLSKTIDWVSGAALVIRADIFRKIGGFDEKFFAYFEDRDLFLGVRKIGYKIMVLPEVKVIHFGGKSLISDKKRKKLYYQSQNYFWHKHYGLLKSICLRFFRLPYIIKNKLRRKNEKN